MKSYTSAKHAAMRFARKKARERGISLRRFQQIHSLASDAGQEFLAEAIWGKGWATVWNIPSEKRLQEARETCTYVIEYGKFPSSGRSIWQFGITIHK